MSNHDLDQPNPPPAGMRAQWAARPFEDAADIEQLDPDADVASNELHATAGTTCVRCGRVIQAGAEVRRTPAGGWEHEVCPPS